MKRKNLITKTLFFLLLCTYTIMSEDMYLTMDDNRSIVIHPDNTWEFEDHGLKGYSENLNVVLSSGRTIVICTNGTWHYQKKSDANDGDYETELESLYSTGYAKNSKYPEALSTAQNEAIRRLSIQIKSVSAHLKHDDDRLFQCIENEEKDQEIEEKSGNNMWEVTVKMTLDKEGIQNIISCSQGDYDLSNEPSDEIK